MGDGDGSTILLKLSMKIIPEKKNNQFIVVVHEAKELLQNQQWC